MIKVLELFIVLDCKLYRPGSYLIDLAMGKRSAAGKVWVGMYGSTGKIAFTAPNGDRHRLNPHPLIMVYQIVSNSDKSSVGCCPKLE